MRSACGRASPSRLGESTSLEGEEDQFDSVGKVCSGLKKRAFDDFDRENRMTPPLSSPIRPARPAVIVSACESVNGEFCCFFVGTSCDDGGEFKGLLSRLKGDRDI